MHDVRVVEAGSRRGMRRLLSLPSRLYRHDPSYVEPLRAEARRQFNRRKNNFFTHGDIQPYLALRGRRVVGSIIAVHNRLYNQYHGDRTGFFMSFECENDRDAAGMLFRAAEDWLRGRGLDTAVGPMSFNGESVSPGLLISGFEHPPFLLMAHHLPYYRDLVEGEGYEKAIDALAFRMPVQQEMDPRLVRLAERVAKTRNITVRAFDEKHFWRDARILFDIYRRAWADNWGFVPPSEEDFTGIVKSLKQIYIRELVLIAEKDGEPVGWAMTLPNINEALIHLKGRLLPFGLFRFLYWMKRIKGLRLWGLGIIPEYRSKGVDAMLYYHTLKEGKRLGFTDGELSWILETNTPVINAAHLVKGTEYKRYRIYRREL
ncbi:MAG: GNAT family N-acetyltransferase [Spirochaetota bacterium]